MARLVSNIAIDMANWNLGNPFDGNLGAHDGSHFAVEDVGPYTYDFAGNGFHYFDDFPILGFAKSMTISDAGGEEVSLTGINVALPAFYFGLHFFGAEAVEAFIFRHDDSFVGSNENDVLRGFDGSDGIRAHKGDDVLDGGGGADRLWGDGGFNTFVYNCANDSTGFFHDRIGNFGVHRDQIKLPTAVDAIDPTVTTGKLSSAHFNATLADAVDADHLGAHHAVLFTPDDGTRAGQTILVVDLNGNAGYQAGEDLVIQFIGNSVPDGLSVANFTT